jgi:hypothetical protein
MRRLMVGGSLVAAVATIGSAAALASSASVPTITVHMKGSLEVMPTGAPKGTGTFKYQDVVSQGLLCYSMTYSHIDTTIASHIHKAKAGVAGNVVIPLSATSPISKSGCVKASKSLLTAIEKHPSQYYVNVHTKKYPGGAIRGQL